MRLNATYTYSPAGYDRLFQHSTAEPGQRVRVVNLPGAPKSGTMGQCHITDAESGELLGMIDCRSLVPVPASQPKRERE